MSTITYTVTVASAKFLIDDAVTPKLTFRDGDTYVFDQADSTNSGHILQFSITSNNSGGAEYTTGVTKTGTPGSAGAKTVIITSTSTTDTLYYYSSGGGTYGEEFSNSGFTTNSNNFLKPIVGAESTAEKWGPMVNHSIDQISEKFTELNKVKTNLAMLAFRQAVDHSDVKYNLQDQIVDEYVDASGVDASASTNEVLTSGVYSSVVDVIPTITHDADATGIDGNDTWYKWTDTAATGSYSTDTAQVHEFLVIAGGGGGGGSGASANGGGGGGAGGYRTSYGSGSISGALSTVESDLSLGSAPTYTITVGAGGTGAADNGTIGGTSSIVGSDITDITTVGGGFGGGNPLKPGGNGGSGGGRGRDGNTTAGGTGTANQGFAGGAAGGTTSSSGGGGGGAGAVGYNGHYPDNSSDPFAPGDTWSQGGVGISSSIDGTATFRGGGGGGAYERGDTAGTTGRPQGGNGGGGHGSTTSGNLNVGTAGSPNTGGGGGAGQAGNATSQAGGSGIVILRRPTISGTLISDLTLQSTDTAAETEADYADMVMLIEDAAGTATINTDVKGYISEDSGVTFTQGTLVDEGDWGTNKRILAFHDLDISAQSGTAMCYKITTHNQSSSKETKIHATSIGWR